MVWNHLVLLSLLLVVPAAGQCDEGTCQSLQPYFSCQVDFGEGAAGAGNTITFARCPGIGDVVVRVRLVGGTRSEKHVDALEVLRRHLYGQELSLPEQHIAQLPAEDRFVEMAFLSGLTSALRSRPIRPIHGKGDGHAELLWREKVRWSMAWVFDIAGPAASCTYCFNDTVLVPLLPLCVRQPGDHPGQCRFHQKVPLPFELEVEVMPRARPIGVAIPEMTVLELLVLLTGYTMDLQKMAFLGFLHDNHLGNLLLVTSLTGERKMAWHDFGARSYFHMPTQPQFESFRKLFDESCEMVIAFLKQHSGAMGLVAQLNRTKSEWSLEGIEDLHGVTLKLATLAERFQEVIMQWTEGCITVRRSLLRTWSRALPPTRLEVLHELLGQGSAALQRPPAVWVCQLGSPDGKDFEVIGNPFQVKGDLANVDDLKKAIKQENPNTVSCDAYQMDIYRREDGGWVKEEKMSASLRETDEADCYGFTIPAGAAGAA
ncbi:unnamed protein product [Effrenium voratum]|uniref:Crinkler effector protein N-terminal domain-containing protein n=1 Tax=Effrenium voratum TaxID=2562239 RepID=A0AA36MYZ0_9DINO|nr:unnamed protein product [Effrenium voratum]CAJ1430931.1 unnamed protein product [Effrenium voratum]CAJ1455258.1 unnamed protein product [Effrenium voratum]